MRPIPVATLLLALSLAATQAPAQLNVDRAVIELGGEERRALLRVSNDGEETLYVRLGLDEVHGAHTAEPRETPLDDPLRAGLLVHPRQLVLGPGQTRSVRVVLDPDTPVPESDRVFRLALSPFAGDALAGEDSAAGVRLLVGYRLLVLLRPERLAPDVRLLRSDEGLAIRNAGNTNVLLRTVEVCGAAEGSCASLPADRLYAGEVLPLALPAGLSPAAARVRTRQTLKHTERVVEYEP